MNYRDHVRDFVVDVLATFRPIAREVFLRPRTLRHEMGATRDAVPGRTGR